MEEFPDELMAKYTRKELEAMAIGLEINTVGLSTKAQLADAIIEVKRIMEETTEEAAEIPAETELAERPAETELTENVAKAELQVGGEGVFAMMGAIEEESRSMRDKALMITRSGQKIRREGVDQMRKKVSEMQRAIDAQVKENQRSIKNFDKSVEEIRTEIDKESRSMRNKAQEIQRAGRKMRQDGINRMEKNVGDFKADIDEFLKVDLENYIKNFYYG